MLINGLPQILARRGLSIRELARQTGVTYSTIWAVVHSERRSVQLEVLEAICLALAIQPGEIYFIVYDDVSPSAPPAIATSIEAKKVKLASHQDLKIRTAEISAEEKQRSKRVTDDWRSW